MDIIDIFEKPMKFFKDKKSFKIALLHFLAAALVFIIINELMIYIGVITVDRKLTGLMAIASNVVSVLSGYFIITAISFFPLIAMGKNNYRDFFIVTAYSLTPLIFFWIPHLVPQAMVVIWSIMLMIVGTAQKMGISYKKAVIPVALFIGLVIVFSILFNNYIFVPINKV